MAEDLPTLVDSFVADLPKFEVTTAGLPDEWRSKVDRASHLLSGGSYLESARASTALMRETDVAYPICLDLLYKTAACAGYMVEAVRLAQAASMADQLRDLTAAAVGDERLIAYLTRLSENVDYRPRRPADVMIAEITFQTTHASSATGDPTAEARADQRLAASDAPGAIQGFLEALTYGYPNEVAKAQGMARLGQAYDLATDTDRAVDWYRKALDSGYLEGAHYIDTARRMAAGVLSRGQNYTAIEWYSKAADAGDVDAALIVGEMLVERDRPMLARNRLEPLASAGNAQAQALLDRLAG